MERTACPSSTNFSTSTVRNSSCRRSIATSRGTGMSELFMLAVYTLQFLPPHRFLHTFLSPDTDFDGSRKCSIRTRSKFISTGTAGRILAGLVALLCVWIGVVTLTVKAALLSILGGWPPSIRRDLLGGLLLRLLQGWGCFS